jgi:hypothetical protein
MGADRTLLQKFDGNLTGETVATFPFRYMFHPLSVRLSHKTLNNL